MKRKTLSFLIGSIAGIGSMLGLFLLLSYVSAQQNSEGAGMTPTIVKAWPASGGKGQYVSLDGSGFGFSAGEVLFTKGGQSVPADVDFSGECKKLYWHNSYVVVKVPSGISEGSYTITVKTPDGKISNTTPFVVTGAAPNPGICGMEPDNGPPGLSFTIYGVGFGNEKGRLVAGSADIPVADAEWTATKITALMPALEVTPAKLRVITSFRTISNPINLTSAARCVQQSCGVGQQCCSDGSCRPDGQCGQEIVACRYTWNFFTGEKKDVGEQCSANDQCSSNRCEGGLCVRGNGGLDAACEFDAQCRAGLVCELGACTLTGKDIGEACSTNSSCASGSCKDGACTAGPKQRGDACRSDQECATNNCVSGTCGQSKRCVAVESIIPKSTDRVYRNSVFRVKFNQLLREDSVRPNVRIEPAVPGELEIVTVGSGDSAKTEVAYRPSQPLAARTVYRVVLGDGITSASGNGSLAVCPLKASDKCSTSGAVCKKEGDICSNGARCIGGTAICSGKGTVCTGPGSKCLDGAKCIGVGSTCIGAGTQCTNTGSQCRGRAECSGANSRCEGLGTQCLGDGSECKSGAACVGKPPQRTAMPAVCDKARQTCTTVNSQCSHTAQCKAIDSSCTGAGTICEGNSSSCLKGATCTGSKSQCSDPGTTCTGSESRCSNGAKCTGVDSSCSGVGTQCTGGGGQCSAGASCNGPKSKCTGSGTACSGVASTCEAGSSCPTKGKDEKTKDGCSEGLVKCADGQCRSPLDSLCKPSSCNANSICDSNESCSCGDCSGQQSSCQTGFVCNGGTKSCQAKVVISVLPTDNARCSVTTPAEVTVGQVFSSQLRIENTGTANWNSADYVLSSQQPPYTSLWGRTSIVLPSVIIAKTPSTISVQATAPAAAGTYAFAWQMRNKDVWFGERCIKSIRVVTPRNGGSCNSNGRCETNESCSCGDCSTRPECQSVKPNPPSCGNGKVDYGEQCDDGDKDNENACRNICVGKPGFCGNGMKEGAEECDDGDKDDKNGCSNVCNSNANQCGNGKKEGTEQCDDGNAVNYDTCHNNCSTNTNRPICTDGIRDLNEQCDDGNTDTTDSCRNDCVGNPGLCRNGILEAGEECDDGDQTDANACTNTCKANPEGCGNKIVNSGEQCDDGDKDDTNACRNDCTIKGGPSPQCGNGSREGTEQCDDKNQINTDACRNDCTANQTGCGNGMKNEGEECDDGDTLDTNSCRNDCRLNMSGGPVCRNGAREDPEQCDDGNSNHTDACRNDCIGNAGFCGNGMKEGAEQCDDGDTNDANACRNTCTPRSGFCGNGAKEGSEQCDDGDRVTSNECLNDCTFNRTGPRCGNSVTEGVEQCDDGDSDNADACRNDCIGNAGFCGNGAKEGTEQCDDGDPDNSNACKNDCTGNAGFCGNGAKEGTEQCDDGDRINANQCRNDCSLNSSSIVCGNGKVEQGEQCDDGDTNNANACKNDCSGSSTSPVCGNGAKEGTEQCDDGDKINSNACTNSCAPNSGFCGNGTQEAGEQCDDGDRIDADQCRNNCTLRVIPAHNARCTINAPQTIRLTPAEFVSGHAFTANIRLQNTGTQTWNATGTPLYSIRSQSPLDNSFWSKSAIAFPAAKQTVRPGEFLEVSTSLIAPAVTGAKPLYWQLMEGDTPVGEMCMASVDLQPQFTNDALCTIRSSRPFCGDGLREGDEQCDDGDRIDANLCKNDCTLRDAAQPYCGNGKKEAGEECDGSDTPNGGRCRPDCIFDVGYCGNGILDAGEQCDDANRIDNDGCTNKCARPATVCGNSIRDRGEQCDDGNMNNDDACSNSCRANAGACGNGVIEAGEQCDDGDRVHINACTNACNTNLGGAWCGNGKPESQIGEQCDDGNLDSSDACTNACKQNTGTCGNGAKEGTEQCDDGDRIDANLCKNDCTLRDAAQPYCGNGKKEASEQCDDGNRSNTDACRTDCQFSKGVCGNGIKDGSEECDDGDRNDANACTNACRAQELPLVTEENKDFLLEFSLTNVGTKTWNPATHIFALRSSGSVAFPELNTIPLARTVAPGDRVTFGVRPYTPFSQGQANLTLQMKEGNSWFGEQCKKSIRLQKPTDPVTPVPEIARIATVEIFINAAEVATTTDVFTCASATGCAGDQSTTRNGNQHTYRTKAFSADGNEVSPKKIEWLATGPTATSSSIVDLSSLSAPTTEVTPKNQNGTSTVAVKVTGAQDEIVQQSLLVTVQLEQKKDGDQEEKKKHEEPTPVTRAISAIRLSTNGDYLPADAFGCVGNSCPDDANSATPGNQHRIIADFYDANGTSLAVPDERITWTLSGATSTIVLSRDSGKTIFATNTAEQGSASLTVAVAGATVTKSLPIENKLPRRECLTARRTDCIGGPDQQGKADEITEAAIEANDRPLGIDLFTCYGNSCTNDRSSASAGNQRVYSLRLHNQNRSLVDPANIAKIEWSLGHTSTTRKSFSDLNPAKNNPEGTKDFDVMLTNTEVDGSATLSATITPVAGKGNPITASIQVINQVQTFLVRDILIKSNGQFLNQDAFGCIENNCKDDRITGSAGNQHTLQVVVTDGTRALSIDQAKVHWSLDRKDLFGLSSENGTAEVNVTTQLNDAAARTGSGIITARVDGIAAIASIVLENKHPYQGCAGTTCIGHPDKQGNPDTLDSIVIDSNGRPITRDIYSCRGNLCEDDRESVRNGNQHTYDVRMHAQNNRLLPLNDIRRIEWALSSSDAFGPSPLRVSGTKGENVVIENTDKPGSAILTATVLPVRGPVRTAEIVLVNDTELERKTQTTPPGTTPPGTAPPGTTPPGTTPPGTTPPGTTPPGGTLPRTISAIRLSTNGDYLPADAFGCIGNSCADDVSPATPGNQHRIIADFYDANGNVLSIPDKDLAWELTATADAMRVSGTGRTVLLTNADSNGEGLLKLSVANATGTIAAELPVHNKYPRATCLTGGRSACTGGPIVTPGPALQAVIDTNGRPVATDRFTCFGDACANDQSTQYVGNQRKYSLRLHKKDNHYISLDDIEKIEWSILPAGSPFTLTRVSDNATTLGAKDTEVYLRNSEVNSSQPATLNATTTTKAIGDTESETFTAEIKVENLLSILQVRSMRIRSNGQFLSRDAFGCIGNVCHDDTIATGNDNQHALELEVKDAQGNVLAVPDSRVHWKLDKKELYRLSTESGAKRINIQSLLSDAATSTGIGIVTAWVDGIPGSATLFVENEHPYQSCTKSGSDPIQCIGKPDKQGNPNIFEKVIIDSNGRPIDIDRFSCAGDSCEDDTDKGGGGRAGNQHRYSLRIHAQNNSLIGTDKIRQVRWELSESQAFREVRKDGSAGKETAVVIENTNQPGSATLTVFVLPLAGTVQQTQIILVNDVIKPDAPPPAATCGNGQVDSGEQCDTTSSAWTTDQCYPPGDANQCAIKDCYQLWETSGQSTDPSGAYQYRLKYCIAKKGVTLPALIASPSEVKDRFATGLVTPLKEYFYRFSNSPDLIVLRIYDNPYKLAPDVWYTNNRVNPNQRPSSTMVDSFPTVQDATGYYISVPILDASASDKSIISYKILNFTTSANPQASTRSIFTELMRTVQFATPQNNVDASKVLRRDMQRLAQVNFIHDQLEQHRVRGQCSPSCYPSLSAGSYTRGQTISGWPSWTQELGKALRASMPSDPSQSTTTPPVVARGDNVKNALSSKKLYAYAYLHTPATGSAAEKYELCTVYEYPLLSQSKLRRQCIEVQSTFHYDTPINAHMSGTTSNSDFAK